MGWLLLAVLLAGTLQAFPTAVSLTTPSGYRLAAVDEGQLHEAAWRAGEFVELGAGEAAGVTSLAPCRRPVGWYAGRGTVLLYRPLAGGDWRVLQEFPDPVVQLLPAPDGSEELVVLTGRPGEPVLQGGQVWRRLPGGPAARVPVIDPAWRPWRLWPAYRDGGPQLAAATWKATHFVPFEHHTLFIFGWGPEVTKTWLGSRLSRPHVDACHADLRGDGICRLVAIELDREGQPSLGVYDPIGFGYEGEWRSGPLPDLRQIRAFGDQVVVGGKEIGLLKPSGNGYDLVTIHTEPVDLDRVTRAGERLSGYWAGAWHHLLLVPGEGS